MFAKPMFTNPVFDYLKQQADSIQAQYDAQYADALKNFNEGCATYQERAQRQYDVDMTIIAPPAVPVRKTCTVVDGKLIEGSVKDPNLHAPVFVPLKATPSAPGAGFDLTNAVTLEQVASLQVSLARKLDAIIAKLGIPPVA